jgi:sensor domain CHASE-containing protein
LAKLSSFGARLGSAIFRPSNIPVAIAVIVILAIGAFADFLNRSVQIERLRGEVLARTSVIRAKLEGNINGNLQLVRGLVAMIEAEPGMTQERFAAHARNLVEDDSAIRNIAAAPDLVVRMVYPVERNRGVVGLDYTKNPRQREAAMRARDTGELIFAGPVDLLQGGQGFIGRFPVFLKQEDGSRTFWGLVSVVIDLERLYSDSGLLDEMLDLKIAITGRDATGAAGERFYGGADVLR